jgi:iron complex outermembrane receptor protein
VQANVRGADGAWYFPGDGRAVYAGLSWRMR